MGMKPAKYIAWAWLLVVVVMVAAFFVYAVPWQTTALSALILLVISFSFVAIETIVKS